MHDVEGGDACARSERYEMVRPTDGLTNAARVEALH